MTTEDTVSTRADEAPGHVEFPLRTVSQMTSLVGMDWAGNEGKSSKITTSSQLHIGKTPEGKKVELKPSEFDVCEYMGRKAMSECQEQGQAI